MKASPHVEAIVALIEKAISEACIQAEGIDLAKTAREVFESEGQLLELGRAVLVAVLNSRLAHLAGRRAIVEASFSPPADGNILLQ